MGMKRLKNAGYVDCGNNSRSAARTARRGKNPNSGNNGPTSRRGSPLIKSTYDTHNAQRASLDDGEARQIRGSRTKLRPNVSKCSFKSVEFQPY